MIFTPDYYHEFSCRAGACPDPCCKVGWQIPLDSESYSFYLETVPDISQKSELLPDGLRVFKTRERGECEYFRDDGLCDIYIKTVGRLCEICAKYPRFFEEYDGFTEAGLSLSCPTAAELVLSQTRDRYGNLRRQSEDPLLQVLADMRLKASHMIFCASDPDAAAGNLLGLGADFQELIDCGKTELACKLEFSPMELLSDDDILAARKIMLDETEILSSKWREALLSEACTSGNFSERRNYLQYLNYRYFLKAVNTEDIFTECQLICFLYRLAAELCENYADGVRLISRELEHNEENMKALRKMLA